jgi:tetratricopeptide (TPR) repeat protein
MLLVLFYRTQTLYLLWNFNLANLYVLRWSLSGDNKCEKEYLTKATHWGERAGKYWINSYEERMNSEVEKTCANVDPNPRALSESSYISGIAYESLGDLRSALVFYQDACNKNRKHILACFSVFRLLDASEPELGKSYFREITELEPDYQLNSTLDERLKLIGFDVLTEGFGSDSNSLPVIIYWDIPNPTLKSSIWKNNDWSYIQIGNRLYQIGEIQNLLPNGSFERDISTIAVLPFGYQNIRYSVNQDYHILSNHHRLDLVAREGEISQVVVIVNPEEKLNGITTKERVKILAGKHYILTGLMKVSESGKGSLGGVWRTEASEDISYWYIARNVIHKTWTRVSGIMTAPEAAEIFTLLALNTGQGEIFIDNLLLFQVTYPELDNLYKDG